MTTKNSHSSILRLPSIESQTIAYVEFAQNSLSLTPATWLEANGRSCYVRYFKKTPSIYSPALGESLVIANLHVEDKERNSGWFWRYMQLCAFLVKDALILESVIEEPLQTSLRKYPEYFFENNSNFIFKKTQSAENWPITYRLNAATKL